MKLVTRNIAQCGLGTMQTTLGSRSPCAEEIHIIIWDSSMTETVSASYDLFVWRSLFGKWAPVLSHSSWGIQNKLNQETGADVFYVVNKMVGMSTTMDEK